MPDSLSTHPDIAALDAKDGGAFADTSDLITKFKIYDYPEGHADIVERFASGEIHASRARGRNRRRRGN